MLTGRSLCFLFASLIVGVSCEIKEEENVLVLTKDNFDSAITDNEFILVEFYAPWCGHCKALAPEYAKAAGVLKEKHPNIKLGKVDATEEVELAEKHQVRGYPTLKFYKKGNPDEYSGGRKAEEIINWLVKKTGPATTKLSSTEEIDQFKEKNDISVIGFFDDDDSEAAKVFQQVAESYFSYAFAVVSDTSLFGEYKDDDIVLYNKVEKVEEVYRGEAKPSSVKRFVTTRSLPLIVEFNPQTAEKIFGGDIQNFLFLFLSEKAGHFDKYISEARAAASDFRDHILFASIDADKEDHNRILEYFGMSGSEVPAIRLIRYEEDIVKYKPEKKDLTADYIKQFLRDYLDGKVKEHLLAQELPEDWNQGPVTTLVSGNFDEVVFDKEKDVLVEFYAPWCGHCKQLEPIYIKLGESFKSNDNVVIAKIDATANELEHTKIGGFPTIKLYKKGDNEVVDYKGERSFEGLKKFVESGGESSDSGPAADEKMDEDDDVPRKDEL